MEKITMRIEADCGQLLFYLGLCAGFEVACEAKCFIFEVKRIT